MKIRKLAYHQRENIVIRRDGSRVMDQLEQPFADGNPDPIVSRLESADARNTLGSPCLELVHQLEHSPHVVCAVHPHDVEVEWGSAALPHKHFRDGF